MKITTPNLLVFGTTHLHLHHKRLVDKKQHQSKTWNPNIFYKTWLWFWTYTLLVIKLDPSNQHDPNITTKTSPMISTSSISFTPNPSLYFIYFLHITINVLFFISLFYHKCLSTTLKNVCGLYLFEPHKLNFSTLIFIRQRIMS